MAERLDFVIMGALADQIREWFPFSGLSVHVRDMGEFVGPVIEIRPRGEPMVELYIYGVVAEMLQLYGTDWRSVVSVDLLDPDSVGVLYVALERCFPGWKSCEFGGGV